jgi:hypothetical protein
MDLAAEDLGKNTRHEAPGNCFRDALTASVHRYAARLLIRPVDAAPCLLDHRHVRPFRFDHQKSAGGERSKCERSDGHVTKLE